MESLKPRVLLAADVSSDLDSKWIDSVAAEVAQDGADLQGLRGLAGDANGDGLLRPIDVLIIINAVSADGEMTLMPGEPMENNVDGWLTLDDASLAIAHLAASMLLPSGSPQPTVEPQAFDHDDYDSSIPPGPLAASASGSWELATEASASISSSFAPSPSCQPTPSPSYEPTSSLTYAPSPSPSYEPAPSPGCTFVLDREREPGQDFPDFRLPLPFLPPALTPEEEEFGLPGWQLPTEIEDFDIDPDDIFPGDLETFPPVPRSEPVPTDWPEIEIDLDDFLPPPPLAPDYLPPTPYPLPYPYPLPLPYWPEPHPSSPPRYA